MMATRWGGQPWMLATLAILAAATVGGIALTSVTHSTRTRATPEPAPPSAR